MSGTPPSSNGSATSLPRGLLRLLRFRADGFAGIPATPRGFLQSLAVQFVLPALTGLSLLASAPLRLVLLYVVASTVALLAPPVISHAMVDAARRATRWLRYATAYNWCQAIISLVFTLFSLASRFEPAPNGQHLSPLQLIVGLLALYTLALNWFLVRAGLEMSRGQATMFLIGVWFTTALVVAAPFVVTALLLHAIG